MNKVILDGNSLTLEDFIRIVRGGFRVELSEEAMKKVEKARNLVDRFVEEEKVVYGITTGFGKFSDVVISSEETKALQRNLIISHSCGVGSPLHEEAAKGIMVLRINALAKGFSGIRPSTLNTLVQMVNKDVNPVIPEKGSIGTHGIGNAW